MGRGISEPMWSIVHKVRQTDLILRRFGPIPNRMGNVLFSFGHGYSAQALARILLPQGWRIVGTTRRPEKAASLESTGIEAIVWPGDDPQAALGEATHLLVSIAPNEEGDPVVAAVGDAIAATAPSLEWAGYLSTTGVYGDRNGGWVDETDELFPATERGRRRVAAERQWQAIAAGTGLSLHIFRLAGIYGPGRGPFEKIRRGIAKRILKPGQVFSRIHVDDIARVLAASINQPHPGAIYNVCDDNPAPPEDVIGFAAELIGATAPPLVDVDQANLTPMARSFYAESKRVRNDRIKYDLGVELLFPDYRSGLKSVLENERI